MKPRWFRLTVIAVQGLLAALWVLNAARYLSRPHPNWWAVLDLPLLIPLIAVSAAAPSNLAAVSAGRASGRRVAVVLGIALAVALAAFVAGYYAFRAG